MKQATVLSRMSISALLLVILTINGASVAAQDSLDLSISITDGLTDIAPGATMLYTITASNVSNVNAKNVSVKAAIPTYTSIVAGSISDGGSVQNGFVVWPKFTLAAQASALRQFTLKLDSALPTPSPASVSVNPTISGTDTNGNVEPYLANNTATDCDNIIMSPIVDIAISQSNGVSGCVPAGQTVPYTLTICNICNTPATGIVVYDVIPVGTDYVSSSDNGVYNPSARTITWPAFNLTSGTCVNRSFVVRIPNPTNLTDITNYAGANDDGSHGADANPSNNTSELSNSICPSSTDLQMAINTVQSCSNQVVKLTYTLSVTNASGLADSGIVIKDTIPTNSTFVSASNGGTLSNGVVTFPTVNLPANSVILRTVIVSVALPLVPPAVPINVVNSATVTDNGANGADANVSNNTAVASTQLSNLRFISDPSATPNPIAIGIPEVFSAVAQDDANPNLPITYTWNFGDGSSGVGANLTHTYSTPGPFTITLSVTNGVGCGIGATLQRDTVGNNNPDVSCKLLKIPLDLIKSNNDSLTLVAAVTLPNNFKPAGRLLTVDIANFSVNARLDNNGNALGLPSNQKMVLRVNGANSILTLKVTKSNLRPLLVPNVPRTATTATLPKQLFVIAFDLDQVGNSDTFGGALDLHYYGNGKKALVSF